MLRGTKPRRALAVVFFVTGAAFGTWAARIPSLQDRLDLSEGDLGIAFAGLMVGAFAALPPAGALVSRRGSRVVLVGSLLVFLSALALVPFAPTVIVLTVLLTVFGGANSGVDVAINTQGADLERRLERPCCPACTRSIRSERSSRRQSRPAWPRRASRWRRTSWSAVGCCSS